MKRRSCWQQERILYSSYVLLYRETCCQLYKSILSFDKFCVEGASFQKIVFTHHFDLTLVNIIQHSVWLCQSTIMSVCLHLYSRHCHPQNNIPRSRGEGRCYLWVIFAKVISSLAFNTAFRLCRWYDLSLPVEYSCGTMGRMFGENIAEMCLH